MLKVLNSLQTKGVGFHWIFGALSVGNDHLDHFYNYTCTICLHVYKQEETYTLQTCKFEITIIEPCFL